MFTKTLLAAAALASLGLAGVASATETLSVKVAYRDLDLSHPAGVETMMNRIHTAARQICGESDARDLGGQKAVRACMRDVTDRATAALAASPMKLAAR